MVSYACGGFADYFCGILFIRWCGVFCCLGVVCGGGWFGCGILLFS